MQTRARPRSRFAGPGELRAKNPMDFFAPDLSWGVTPKRVGGSVQFATLSLPCFNYYRDLFYNSENLKIVPSIIKNLLTPRGLAYWIILETLLKNTH
jgi:hypothetical protein